MDPDCLELSPGSCADLFLYFLFVYRSEDNSVHTVGSSLLFWDSYSGFPGLFSKHPHLLSHFSGPNQEVLHKHLKPDSERLAELYPKYKAFR